MEDIPDLDAVQGEAPAPKENIPDLESAAPVEEKKPEEQPFIAPYSNVYTGFSSSQLESFTQPHENIPDLEEIPDLDQKTTLTRPQQIVAKVAPAVVQGVVSALEPIKEGTKAIVESVAPTLDEIYRSTPLVENQKLWINLGEIAKSSAHGVKDFILKGVELVNGLDMAAGEAAKRYFNPSWMAASKIQDLEDNNKPEIVPKTYLSTDVFGPGVAYFSQVIGKKLQENTLIVPSPVGLKKMFGDLLSQGGVGYKPYSDVVDNFWNNLSENDFVEIHPSQGVKSLGEWVEALGGATGFTSGLALSWYTNPLQFVKVGQLTKTGLEMEKLANLEIGLGKQAAAGQRALIQFAPDVPGLRWIEPKTVTNGAKFLDGLERIYIATEASTPLKWLRNFSSYTGFSKVDEGLDNLNQAKHGINVINQEAMGTFYVAQAQKGINLADPTIRKFIYEYAQQPERALEVSGVKGIVNQLNNMLYERRLKLAMVGVDIPEFKPEMDAAKIMTGQYSERYFPTGTSPSQLHKKALAEILGDSEELKNILEDLPFTQKGQMSLSQNPFKQKSKLTKDAMNKLIEEATGGVVKEFFYDDPVMAVFEKLNDLDTLYARKVFEKQVSPFLKDSPDEWQSYIALTRKKNEELRALGQFADADSLRIENMSMKNVREVKSNFPGFKGKFAPDSIASAIENAINAPDRGKLTRFIGTWMNAQKANWFFSPGWMGRNIWENMGRYIQSDATVVDAAKAFGNMMFPNRKKLSVKNLEVAEGLISEQDMMKEFYHRGGLQAWGSIDIFPEGGPRFSKAQEMAENEAAKTLNKIRVTNSMLDLPGPEQNALSTLHRNSISGNIKQILESFTAEGRNGSLLSDNPLYRSIRIANETGEGAFRYATYKNLRLQGYSEEMAMRKTNNLFMKFSDVRGSVRKMQLASPFFNYQVKNLESFITILQKRPQAIGMIGPGGAIERAITNWSGWSPDAPQRIREVLGNYNAYSIPSIIMPGHDSLVREKDPIKKMIANHFGEGFAGWQLMINLPSNVHALDFMSPDQFSQEMSPFLRVGIKMFGTDPTSGEPMNYSPKMAGLLQRAGAMVQEMNPLKFSTTAQLVQNYVEEIWPEYEKNATNFGLDPETHKAIIDSVLKFTGATRNVYALDDKTKKAISKFKSVFMGRMTQLDVDFYYRTSADLRTANALLKDIARLAPQAKDKSIGGPMDQIGLDVYSLRELLKGTKQRSEFFLEWHERQQQVAPSRVNPAKLEIPTEWQDEDKALQENEEIESQEKPETPEETDSFLEEKYQEAIKSGGKEAQKYAAAVRENLRTPASIQDLTQRASDLTKQNLSPTNQEVAPEGITTEEALPPEVKPEDLEVPEGMDPADSVDPIDHDLQMIDHEISKIQSDKVPDATQFHLLNQLMAQKINLLKFKVDRAQRAVASQ